MEGNCQGEIYVTKYLCFVTPRLVVSLNINLLGETFRWFLLIRSENTLGKSEWLLCLYWMLKRLGFANYKLRFLALFLCVR